MKIIGHFEEQHIAPQSESGVCFSATGRVLVLHGRVRLIWRKGGLYWSGIGNRNYAPACLQVIHWDGEWTRTSTSYWNKDILEGGRLSGKRIEEALPKIRELMKLPALAMEYIDLKKTFVVDRVEETDGSKA